MDAAMFVCLCFIYPPGLSLSSWSSMTLCVSLDTIRVVVVGVRPRESSVSEGGGSGGWMDGGGMRKKRLWC